MLFKFKLVFLSMLIVSVLCGQSTYYFTNISGSSAIDAAIGEGQLSLEVSDAGSGNVLFKFLNAGSNYCRIDQVYFDDHASSVLNAFSLIDADDGIGGDSNVDFSPGASPPDLPAGTTVGFNVSSGLLCDSDSPGHSVVSNPYKPGVEPGQWLGVLFTLQPSNAFLNVISQLDSENLVVGVHVQGYVGGGSESFITYSNGNGTIPAPSAVLLGAIGVGMVGWLKRRVI